MRTNEGGYIARRRAAQSYLMPRDVPHDQVIAGKICRNCRHFAQVFKPMCAHGDFAVVTNAACAQWEMA